MARRTFKNAAEVAAFKAANLAANARNKKTIVIEPKAAPQHTERQRWIDTKNETLDMINAAKRQGHFHLLPQLMQRLQNAHTMLASLA